MSAAGSKVSFTVRRPSPVSRETSSGPDSDTQPFKIPALPRHLNGNNSTPGSPLARSAAPSPKRSFHERDSDDEGEEIQDELVVGFDQFGVQRLNERRKTQGPLVIPSLKNRDWREFAKKRKTNEMFVPESARAAMTGADGSVAGLGTKDTINSGPQAVGLHIKEKKMVAEVRIDVEMVERYTHNAQVEETEDQKAIRALLASATSDNEYDGSQIEKIPVQAITEDDAYRQDIVELPDSATLDDYERIPVSQFGAALLRGMGWKEGNTVSRARKGLIEPWVPQARPALLGIGAKEKEVLDDGSRQRKYGGKPDKKYIPLVKTARSGGEHSGSRSSSMHHHTGSRSIRPPSATQEDRRHRDGTEDRWRDGDYGCRDDHRDRDGRVEDRNRDKSSGRRDRGREGRRDRSQERNESSRKSRKDQ